MNNDQYHLILFLLSLFVSVKGSFNVSYIYEGIQTIENFPSPRIQTSVKGFSSNVQLYIPMDHGNGCIDGAYTNSRNKMILVNDLYCLLSQKIVYSCNNLAAGIIIIWSGDTIAGLHYKSAIQGINPGECTDILALEITQNHGERLQWIYQVDRNATITYTNNDINQWEIAFESSIFLGFYRIFQSYLYIMLFIYSSLHFFFYFSFYISMHEGKMKFIHVFFTKDTAYIYYIVLSSIVIFLSYIAGDPLGNQGLYSRESILFLLTFSLPTTFITSAIMQYKSFVSIQNRYNHKRKNNSDSIRIKFMKSVLFGIVLYTISVFLIDVICSAFIAKFVAVWIYEDINIIFSSITIIILLSSAGYLNAIYVHLTSSIIKIGDDEKLPMLPLINHYRRYLLFQIMIYACWLLLIFFSVTHPLWWLPEGMITISFLIYIANLLCNFTTIYFIEKQYNLIEATAIIYRSIISRIKGVNTKKKRVNNK